MSNHISDEDYKRYSEFYYKNPRFASWTLTDFIRFCVEWEKVNKEIRELALKKEEG